jgi:UDP-N-acetyl-2-amino-2-deoxyglucuronate dehydrogenase
MTVRLGIIGCGRAATEIVRASQDIPALEIVAVCDTDRTRAEALGKEAKATVAPDIDDLLATPGTTTIYVGLPHVLLAPTVERALHAGKHILAEKPLALEAKEALRLGALARSRSLKLCVFYELRRSGPVEAARDLIAAGTIGEPRLVRLRTIIDKPLSYWGPPGATLWRAHRAEAGGGVVMMNTVHQLDTLRYVTGLDYASALGATATFSAPADVEDTASATLRLSNGAIVSLVASAHSPGAKDEETVEIDGTLGRLNLPDPFGTAPMRLFRSATNAWEDLPTTRPDSHRRMLESFVHAIEADGNVPANATDAAAALSVVNAIYESVRTGRLVDIQ